MTGIAKVKVGALVKLEDQRDYMVCRFDSPTSVVLQDMKTNTIHTASLEEIRCDANLARHRKDDLHAISQPRLDEAKARYLIIKPLIDAGRWTTSDIELAAAAAGVTRSSIYRWLKQFGEGSVVSNLMRKRRADMGTLRLPQEIEAIVANVIAEYWLTPERRVPAAAYREVRRRCYGSSPRLAPPV